MRPVADPGLPRARVDRGKAARGFSALARGVVAEPWDEPAPLRAAPVGPERGCKAQASAQACLSDRLAARRSRAGSGRAGGGSRPPQVVGVVASRLGLGRPLLRPSLALLAPYGSCLLYRQSCRSRRAISLPCFVASCGL